MKVLRKEKVKRTIRKRMFGERSAKFAPWRNRRRAAKVKDEDEMDVIMGAFSSLCGAIETQRRWFGASNKFWFFKFISSLLVDTWIEVKEFYSSECLFNNSSACIDFCLIVESSAFVEPLSVCFWFVFHWFARYSLSMSLFVFQKGIFIFSSSIDSRICRCMYVRPRLRVYEKQQHL